MEVFSKTTSVFDAWFIRVGSIFGGQHLLFSSGGFIFSLCIWSYLSMGGDGAVYLLGAGSADSTGTLSPYAFFNNFSINSVSIIILLVSINNFNRPCGILTASSASFLIGCISRLLSCIFFFVLFFCYRLFFFWALNHYFNLLLF